MNTMTTTHPIQFKLNGEGVHAQIQPHHTLLETLRQQFNLNGARESCSQGLCGTCTVLVNGQPVSSCLSLALTADGCEVSTIEQGLDAGGQLDDVQQAFIEFGALQCSFCTPGFILMSRDLLSRNSNPSEEDIRNHLSGNLCRCGTYPEIIRAVQSVARQRQGKA